MDDERKWRATAYRRMLHKRRLLTASFGRRTLGVSGKFFVAGRHLWAAQSGDCGEERLDLHLCEIAGDKDEARTAVVVGPVEQLDRAVRDMLDDVHDDRAAAPRDRDEPLDAQEIGPAPPGASTTATSPWR